MHHNCPQENNREEGGFERTGLSESDSCCLKNSARGVLTVGSKKWEGVQYLLQHEVASNSRVDLKKASENCGVGKVKEPKVESESYLPRFC